MTSARLTKSIAAMMLSLLVVAPGAAQTTCVWNAIDNDGERSENWLSGVAVRSGDRAWAAGWRTVRGGRTRTHVRFWNGSRWRRQDTPNSSDVSNQLNDVDAGRRGAVWAVGEAGSPTLRTIALRRTSRGWKRTNTIDPSPSLNSFNHVAGYSRRQAWAVGTRWDASGDHLYLIERWKARRWRVVGPSNEGILHGVFARAPDDVWAVGVKVRNGVGRTATLHFNGRRWREIASPNQNGRFHVLYAVASSGPRDAWAVGSRATPGGNRRPISMHWNGSRWRLVDTPSVGRQGHGELRGISVRGDDAVAVGQYYRSSVGFRALILEWTGSTWALRDTTTMEQSIDLADVDHTPAGETFAAGVRTTHGGSEVILRRSC